MRHSCYARAVSERRRGTRAPIELNVEYKRVNTFFSDYTRNISKGGTFIRTSRPLDVGTEFVFALRVPLLDEPLRLRGTVKWIITAEESSPQNQPGMGIEFIYADTSERRATEGIVERLMARELGEALSHKLLKKR